MSIPTRTNLLPLQRSPSLEFAVKKGSPIPLVELRATVPELVPYLGLDVENQPPTRCISVEDVAAAIRALQEDHRQKLDRALQSVEMEKSVLEDQRRERLRWYRRTLVMFAVLGIASGCWWWLEQSNNSAESLPALAKTELQEPADPEQRVRDLHQQIRTGLNQIAQVRNHLQNQLRLTGGIFHQLETPWHWRNYNDANQKEFDRLSQLRQQAGTLPADLERDYHNTLHALPRDRNELTIALRGLDLLDMEALRGPTVSPDQLQNTHIKLFRDLGIDILNANEDHLTGQIKASSLRELLVVLVDSLAELADRQSDEELYHRFSALARRTDLDPIHKHIPLAKRVPRRAVDRVGLAQVAEDLRSNKAAFAKLSPRHLVLVGKTLAVHDCDAVSWFDRCHLLHPSEFSIQYALAEVLLPQAPRQAVSQFRAALALRPESAVAWMGLAHAFARLGNQEEAVVAYEQVLKRKPQAAAAWLALADLHQRLDNPTRAHHALQKTVEIVPTYVQGWQGLGSFLLYTHRDYPTARSAIQRARKLDPENLDLFVLLVETLLRQAEYVEAETQIERTAQQVPSKLWKARLEQLTRRLEKVRSLDQRLREVRNGGTTTVTELLTLAEFAAVYVHRPAEAQRLYESAFEEDPTLFDRTLVPHRYNAARNAVLATQDPKQTLGDKLRRFTLARRWLEAELIGVRSRLAQSPELTPEIAKRLTSWKQNRDLQQTRFPHHPDWLIVEEQEAWNAFWNEVDQLCQELQ